MPSLWSTIAIAWRTTAAVATSPDLTISIGHLVGTTPSTFLAHGWEPWTAISSFVHFDNPAVVKAVSHLKGQTVRFGGISADWLAYTVNSTVTPGCSFPIAWDGQACPFSTGAFDLLLDFLSTANIRLLFDLNELSGRNCSQPGPKPWQPAEWCGDEPAAWDLKPMRALLQHVRDRGLEGVVGFELGNELFAPPHLSPATAAADVTRLAALFREVWTGDHPPRLYATGTNDCENRNNSDTMAALATMGIDGGFSFHSYPGDMRGWWDKSDLPSFLLNSSWLRSVTLAQTAPCLAAWNDGPRAKGLFTAVTEAAAISGGDFGPGDPTTASFVHGFFSIAQLGQYALSGVAMVARWGLPGLLALHGAAKWKASDVASDLFLYVLYNATVGHGVLRVTGDDASDVLVYAHCAAADGFGANGSVTLLVANPSNRTVALRVSGLPSRPRLEYVLTAPNGDLAAHTPVLNGDTDSPLALGADGSLPPMLARFCGDDDCTEALSLPPRSQSFFVLLGARSAACSEEDAMVESVSTSAAVAAAVPRAASAPMDF